MTSAMNHANLITSISQKTDIMITNITYTTRRHESFTGRLSQPTGDKPLPGIVLLTAIFGMDAEMQTLADAYASEGFIVSVPDYFWRQRPGPTADRDVATARMHAYDPEQGLMDIEDVINHLRAQPRCTGKIAVLGFCFGGWIAHLSAARFGVDAAAAYHGTRIGQYLDEMPEPECPVSFHFGADDPIVPQDEVASIQAAYRGHENADIVVYPQATHNFAMPDKPGYHPEVATASRQAVLACFKQHLAA